MQATTARPPFCLKLIRTRTHTALYIAPRWSPCETSTPSQPKMVDSKKAAELAMFAPLSPLSPIGSTLLSLCLWIPLEILEQILDYCRDDRATLRACSLASRVLRPAAQRYLFHNLVFHNVSGDPYMRLSYIQTHPHLMRRVKSISYVESVDHGSWTTFAQFIPSEMRLRSAHFAVRSTTAIGIPGDDSTFPETSGLVITFASPAWSGLTALSIRGATFPNVDVFAAMLAPLHALRLLELDPVMMHPSPTDTPIRKPTFSQPCTLRLSFFQGLSSLGAMLPWLAAGAEAGNIVLQVLSVPLQSTDLRPLEGALGCCGSGISMLQLVGAAYVRGTSGHASSVFASPPSLRKESDIMSACFHSCFA